MDAWTHQVPQQRLVYMRSRQDMTWCGSPGRVASKQQVEYQQLLL